MYKKNDHPRYLPLSFLENLRNIGLNALFQLVVFIMFLHLGKRGKKKKHIDIGNKYVLQEEIIKQYI